MKQDSESIDYELDILMMLYVTKVTINSKAVHFMSLNMQKKNSRFFVHPPLMF